MIISYIDLKLLFTVLCLIHCQICPDSHKQDILSFLQGDKEVFPELQNKVQALRNELNSNTINMNKTNADEDSSSNKASKKEEVSSKKTNAKMSLNNTKNISVSKDNKEKANLTVRSNNSKNSKNENIVVAKQKPERFSLLMNNTRITKEVFMLIPFWFENDRSLMESSISVEKKIEQIKEFLYGLYEKVS